ncbi:MAG: ABC transporter permease [Chloroflexota bacterium]|nr:ABC transporter permease [Chloroflexota bacterium]
MLCERISVNAGAALRVEQAGDWAPLMVSFLVNRLVQGAIVLIGASMLIFALVRATGNPAVLLLPPDATQEDVARVTAQLGLDKPLPEQYEIFVSQALHGDFGTSIQLHRPVVELLGDRLPYSLKLGGLSLFFAVLIGIPLGIVAAVKKGTVADGTARGLALVGQSVPSFWLGVVLVATFAGKLRLLPAARAEGPSSYVLPVITLVLTGFLLSGTIRFVRAGMLDVMAMDYVKMARAKGLSERLVVGRHALRNALIPLVTFLGFYLTFLLGGISLIAELVFAWPGVGPLLYQAILSRDFPIVQAVVILYVTGFVVVSIVVDLAYVILDPTIRLP